MGNIPHPPGTWLLTVLSQVHSRNDIPDLQHDARTEESECARELPDDKESESQEQTEWMRRWSALMDEAKAALSLAKERGLGLEFVGDVSQAEKQFDVWTTRFHLKAVADAALREAQAKVRALREAEVKKAADRDANELRASESTRVGSVSLPSPVLGDVDIEMEGEEDAEGEEVEEQVLLSTSKAGKKKQVDVSVPVVPNVVNDPKCARCMKAKGGRVCEGLKGKKCTGCVKMKRPCSLCPSASTKRVEVVDLVEDEDEDDDDKSVEGSGPRLHCTRKGKGRSASTEHVQELRALEAKAKSSAADMYEQGERLRKLRESLYPGGVRVLDLNPIPCPNPSPLSA
ncbi:hypothetical protein M405DRAFT_838557 [Rhizopogon salebrosus TDB-379]|nr:hypothetical protein M405DRAFT_838557 [Rhizopogon salebrosus TDB-379]